VDEALDGRQTDSCAFEFAAVMQALERAKKVVGAGHVKADPHCRVRIDGARSGATISILNHKKRSNIGTGVYWRVVPAFLEWQTG
jgi:hypothetical protein